MPFIVTTLLLLRQLSPISHIMTTPTKLYRHFDSNNKLLYVGISSAPLIRIAKHTGRSWGQRIARVDLQQYPTREEALIAERTAIQNEQPEWNVLHNHEEVNGMRVSRSKRHLTPEQYQNALDKLGLTQGEAADLLGFSIRTSNGYANGGYPVPKPLAVLLRLLLSKKIGLDDIA